MSGLLHQSREGALGCGERRCERSEIKSERIIMLHRCKDESVLDHSHLAVGESNPGVRVAVANNVDAALQSLQSKKKPKGLVQILVNVDMIKTVSKIS